MHAMVQLTLSSVLHAANASANGITRSINSCFDHLEIINTIVLLTMLSVSYDIIAGTTGVT